MTADAAADTLHIVSRSPLATDALATCLRLSRAGSSVLLIEDAVYAALATVDVGRSLRALARRRVLVLGPDLLARCGSSPVLRPGVTVVDDGGFVDLVCDHARVRSWL